MLAVSKRHWSLHHVLLYFENNFLGDLHSILHCYKIIQAYQRRMQAQTSALTIVLFSCLHNNLGLLYFSRVRG